jgi:hypothetical protein
MRSHGGWSQLRPPPFQAIYEASVDNLISQGNL